MKCARLNSTFIIFWVVKMEFKNSHYGGGENKTNKCPMIWDDYWAFVFMSSGRINVDTTGIRGNEIVSSNHSGNGLLSLKLSENMIKCLYYSFRDECGFGRITRDTFLS